MLRYKQWLEFFKFFADVVGLWQWITAPILVGGAMVLAAVSNQPPLFFYSVVGIVVVLASAYVGLKYLSYKKWCRIMGTEDEKIFNILRHIRNIHKRIEEKADEVTISKQNQDIDQLNEDILAAYEIDVGKAIQYMHLAKKHPNAFIKKVSNRKLLGQQEGARAVEDVDALLGRGLFPTLKDDQEYRKLVSELAEVRMKLAPSNERVSELIDGLIRWSINAYTGMVYERIAIKRFDSALEFKLPHERLERQIEPEFNKRLERVRLGIRREIMRSV